MTPIKLPNKTRVFTAPPGRENEVESLDVIDILIGHETYQTHAIVSAWQPSVQELALMASGTPILLWIHAEQISPVALSVGDPSMFSIQAEASC